MSSRLLGALDARIKEVRDPVENACLRAEKASLLARQGHLDAARAELRDLRARFDSRPHAAVSAWASLADGLVAYFEDLNASARDKFMRALALSQSYQSPTIEAVSAAWLAQADLSNMDFQSMIRHLAKALDTAPVTLHSARSRASLVAAEAYHWAERIDLALPWYSLARQHAAAEGDEASLSALMHNMAWLRTAEARRRSVFGNPDEVQKNMRDSGLSSLIGLMNSLARPRWALWFRCFAHRFTSWMRSSIRRLRYSSCILRVLGNKGSIGWPASCMPTPLGVGHELAIVPGQDRMLRWLCRASPTQLTWRTWP